MKNPLHDSTTGVYQYISLYRQTENYTWKSKTLTWDGEAPTQEGEVENAPWRAPAEPVVVLPPRPLGEGWGEGVFDITKNTLPTTINQFYKNAIPKFILLCLITGWLFLFEGIAHAQDQTTPPDSGPQFENFELIWQRNIFDPTRKKVEPEPIVQEPEPEIDEFALIGTLVTDIESYAFFEGNRPELNGVIKEGNSIDQFLVEAIATTSIHLVSGEKRIPFDVGMALQRIDDQDWELVDNRRGGSPLDRSTPSSGPLAANSEKEEDESNSEGTNDVLKRLMEQRKQELNQ